MDGQVRQIISNNVLCDTFIMICLYSVSSTTLECNEIATAATGDDVVRRITGSNVTERFTGMVMLRVHVLSLFSFATFNFCWCTVFMFIGPQIRSFSKSEEGAYNKTGRIHLVSSFVASVLCGEDVAIDRGDAAGMNLMDLSTSQWSDVMMHATARNLAAKLPPIVPSDSVVGQIGSYCVEKYGFVAGTPIVAFSGDNPNSLVGMGAHCSGTAVISLGTSDTYFASMSTADAAASEGNPYGSIFGNPAGGSFCLTCFKNGSLAREAVRDMFDMTWDAFSCSLRNTVSGNNGNMMLGYFVPEITPLVLVPGAQLFGDDEFVRWDCSGSTIRGIVEGQAMSMRYHACWMAAPTRVVMTGGASNNDEVVQVFADVFGVVVERLSVTNSAALGAAMRAAAAFSPPHITLDDICGQFACPEASKSIYPNSSAHAEYNALLPLFELRLRGYLGSLDKAVHS